MKKLIALLLCLVMTVSLFAACDSQQTGLQSNDGTQQTEPPATVKKEEYPDDLTISIGLPLAANVEDYDTNSYTLWLEEVTGFNLEFVTFQSATADYRAQLSAMMATGDELPDILYNINLTAAAVEEYGSTGYFIDLAPYYSDPDLGAEIQTRLNSIKESDEATYKLVMDEVTSENGGMYAYPRVEYSMIDTMSYQAYINQDWLTKLNLKMPTDPESLYDVLVAFRDGDPNGNGKKDEKPLIGEARVIKWIMNMFLYYNDEFYYNVDENNQLYLWATTEEYREGLIYLRKLMDEGLMFDTVFSMANKDIKALVCSAEDEPQTVGIFVGHPSSVLLPGSEKVYSYVAMPYWGNAARKKQAVQARVFITKDCEYPTAAWEVLMAMTTKEGAYRQRYGEKGIDWVDADPNTKSFLDWDADIKVINEVWGTQNNQIWAVIMGTVLEASENERTQVSNDTDEWLKYKLEMMKDCYDEFTKAEKENNPPEEQIIRFLHVPQEVSDATKNEWSATTTLIKQSLSDFICGTGTYNNPSSDAVWNAYVAAIEATGYQTYLEHRQMLYEDQYPERVK